jgi:Protein of unknown function (DUF1573)
MDKRYKVVLLTILVLSVFAIAIVELAGISQNSLAGRNAHGRNEGRGEFYDKSGQTYHGEIQPDQNLSRCDAVNKMGKTTMQFYETKFNFGEVTQGQVVKHSFRFKNTGQNPLMICKTDVTCGCTVPSFPQENIPPGQEGEILVEFNTAGKSGFQQKNIIVHSNAMPEAVSIGIEADVK